MAEEQEKDESTVPSYINPRGELSKVITGDVKSVQTTPTLIQGDTQETTMPTQQTLGTMGQDLTTGTVNQQNLKVTPSVQDQNLGQIASIESVLEDVENLGGADFVTKEQPSYAIGDIQGQLSE